MTYNLCCRHSQNGAFVTDYIIHIIWQGIPLKPRPRIQGGDVQLTYHRNNIFITRVREVIMFSSCVFVCLFVSLSRCLSGRFNYEGLVPHKQYFAGTLLGMSSCASYVSRTHDIIDDVTRSQSRSNFEIDISPSIFELECRSKAQNVGNAHGYRSGIVNFWYNFR